MFVQKAIFDFKKEVETLFVKRQGATLSLDTFFNSLNLYLIKHYTGGKNLFLRLDYSGDASFKVIHSYKKQSTVLFESNHLQKNIEIDLSNLGELGIIYPVFVGDFVLKSLTYEVDAPNKEISTAIVITTYNKQEFVIPNLYKLSLCKSVNKVIVVDNGRNVSLPADLDKNKFIIISNGNIGGSGGFTRGMHEAKQLGFSHVFLMDDDVVLLPEVIEKAISAVSCFKEDHNNDWLGFSILPFDTPTMQLELGAEWRGQRVLSKNKNLDLSKSQNFFKNYCIDNPHLYSGWWGLIMPTTVLTKYGYPLPFFIKFDDIEYGLRRKGDEIVLTNGFAMWHENFVKKYNSNRYLEYYISRNALITNSIHDKNACVQSEIRFIKKCIKSYFKCQYTSIYLTRLAIDDFLKGPDYLLKLDIEKKNNEIREIAKIKINFLKGILFYPFICLYYAIKLLFRFKKIKELYIKKFNELISEQFWIEVFDNAK